ncbi:MAG: hypothetical protein M3T96_03430 [Acidobacteriota bacterium]|nr:hypothetical protein [Acidobacteriota bacterium]
MKNRLIANVIAIFLGAAVLISLSCKHIPQNTSNTATNANQSGSTQNGEYVSALGEDCSGNNDDKIKKVKRRMGKKIGGSSILNPQYKEDGSGNFDFNVLDVNGDVVLYVWGFVYTEPENNVDELNKIFKGFVKKGCVAKVVFGESSDDTTIRSRGFEYNLCEYPNEVCSNGICSSNCP